MRNVPDYKEMYFTLFNAVTDALAAIQNCNIGEANELLQQAQQKTESLYIEAE